MVRVCGGRHALRLHLKTAVEIKQVGMLVKLPDPTLQIQQKALAEITGLTRNWTLTIT